MAALDILLDYPGAEYKLAKAFSVDPFVCEVKSEARNHNPGDGQGERKLIDVRLQWFKGRESVGHGWFVIDEADPKLLHFQGLYIDDDFQGMGIFTAIVGALDLWHEIGIVEGRVGGTDTSAPTFKNYGFAQCDRPIMAGGEPLAIYSKPTCNSQDELESSNT